MQLICDHLSIHYKTRKALNAFNLQLKRGEICTLIGPNGSGKSTALQAIAGLIPPTQGKSFLDNYPVQSMSRRLLARKLAFLPQQPLAPDEMRVCQLVRQGRFAHVGLLRSYKKSDEEAIEWALHSTGLSGYGERFLNELSGGERQRAWIAAAIAQEAEILLLDEPTSFLDIGYQAEVLDLVYQLSREYGTTILISIHDINQAMAICDRIVLLDGGKQIFNGTADILAQSGLIEKTFRVKGQFVSLRTDAPPHFDIEWLTSK
ncbi:ABC transporter ATP-binding protein [Paenochrobactrum pullorum]|uniref:ABC transporter ATP-binding protein n=1 Tax=Paenochrobactrum pullorum TaxID=1324351 RepID=UPI0035BBBCFF